MVVKEDKESNQIKSQQLPFLKYTQIETERQESIPKDWTDAGSCRIFVLFGYISRDVGKQRAFSAFMAYHESLSGVKIDQRKLFLF